MLYLAAIALWFAALVELGVDGTTAGVMRCCCGRVLPVHAEDGSRGSASRKGLLGAMFAGVCAVGYARFRAPGSDGRPGRRIGRDLGWLALATIAAVLAVWSKAQAAFAIAALVAFELALPARRASWGRSLAGLGTIAIAGAAAFVPVLMMASRAAVVGLGTYAGGNRVTTVLGVLGFYARLSTMTIGNAIAYPISVDGPGAIDLVLGAIALVALIAVVAVPRRGWWAPSPIARAGAAVWLVCWLPISHVVVSLEMVMVADRYLLLPTLGLALALAAALGAIPIRRARVALIATITIAAALRTFGAQANWATPLALWERAVESSPDDAEAWSFYAEGLADSAVAPISRAPPHRPRPRAPAPTMAACSCAAPCSSSAPAITRPAWRRCAAPPRPASRARWTTSRCCSSTITSTTSTTPCAGPAARPRSPANRRTSNRRGARSRSPPIATTTRSPRSRWPPRSSPPSARTATTSRSRCSRSTAPPTRCLTSKPPRAIPRSPNPPPPRTYRSAPSARALNRRPRRRPRCVPRRFPRRS